MTYRKLTRRKQLEHLRDAKIAFSRIGRFGKGDLLAQRGRDRVVARGLGFFAFRSEAAERGRNADWAESAVREAASIGAAQAAARRLPGFGCWSAVRPFDSLYRHGFLRVAASTLRTSIADPPANAESVLRVARECQDELVGLVVFPELAVTGYPPEDLVFKPSFLAASQAIMFGRPFGIIGWRSRNSAVSSSGRDMIT